MRPLICFDIESTGPNPATDRIVELAFSIVSDCPLGEVKGVYRINPGRPIPKEATEVHGIDDDAVSGLPRFEFFSKFFHDTFRRCDLLGFNLTNFDVPLLWEEFYRCEIEWDLSETRILDAGTLFKRREERTLAAAVQFYCGREHLNAHNAMADVLATVDVWSAQVSRYKLQNNSREDLERESNYEEKRVDLAGKIVVGKDGRPTYNFGKCKGVAVEDDRGFGRWMLDKDFTENTKRHVEAILYPKVEVVVDCAISNDCEPF